MGGEQMPPMGNENGMSEELPLDGSENVEQSMPNTSNDMNNPNAQQDDMSSEFDSNFDAGVEADEDTDPKKFIQQLTGKLSQSLNTYNEENGKPDTELGKYVLGMLVTQGTKGMDEKDKKDIIKKIKSNNESDSNEDYEMPENDSDSEIEDSDTNNMKMESKVFKLTKKQIFENFGIAIDDEKKESNTKIQNDTVKNRRTRPFEAPKKFRD